jgi:hypothetical protein
MEHKITVEWDQIQSIIKHELAWDLEQLKKDLEARKKGEGMAIWDHDQDKDVALCNMHIEALKLVLKYYGA